MGLVTIPNRPTGSQPRSIAQILANFDEITQEINGNLDVTNAPSLAIPSGVLSLFGGASAPSGWLLCDGAAVSRSTYAALFAVVGATYGTGDGSTTFNLPDLRGRVPVGKGSHSDVDVLGDNDGIAVASRRPKHGHTVNSHAHAYPSPIGRAASQVAILDPAGNAWQSGESFGGQATTPRDLGSGIIENGSVDVYRANTDAAAPATDVQGPSYLTLNYIIKT